MRANYAGVDLLHATKEVRDVVARQLRPEAIFQDLSERGRKTSAWTFINHTLHHRPIVLDSIWWPQGAMRWAQAYWTCTGEDLQKIEKITHAGKALHAATLKWSTDDSESPGFTREASFFQLPAIPIWQSAEDPAQKPHYSPENLYLLPLVDQRYFWWFNESADIDVGEGCNKTWDDLYDDISSALGTTIERATVHSDYLKPCHLLTSHWQFIPQLLDTVAYNVGQRIVVNLDGSVVAHSSAASLNANTDFLDEDRIVVLGEDLFPEVGQGCAVLPNKVVVVYPKQVDADLHYLCKYDTKEVTLASLALPEVQGVIGFDQAKVFQDTSLWFDGKNDTEITNLTTRIATDWYRFQMGRVQGTYDGVLAIDPQALFDTVEWVDTGEELLEYEDSEDPDQEGDLAAWSRSGIYTIVRRAPFNDLAHELLHCGAQGCDPDCEPPPCYTFCASACMSLCFDRPEEHLPECITFCASACMSLCLPSEGSFPHLAKVQNDEPQTVTTGSSDSLEFATIHWDTDAYTGSTPQLVFTTYGKGRFYHIDYEIRGTLDFCVGSLPIVPTTVESYVFHNPAEEPGTHDGNFVGRTISTIGTGTTAEDWNKVFLQGSTDVYITDTTDTLEVILTNNASVSVSVTDFTMSIHAI